MRETVIDYETVEREVEVLYCDECEMEVEELYSVAVNPAKQTTSNSWENRYNEHCALYGIIRSTGKLEWCADCVVDKCDLKSKADVPEKTSQLSWSIEEVVPEVHVVKEALLNFDDSDYEGDGLGKTISLFLFWLLAFPFFYPPFVIHAAVNRNSRFFTIETLPPFLWGIGIALAYAFFFM